MVTNKDKTRNYRQENAFSGATPGGMGGNNASEPGSVRATTIDRWQRSSHLARIEKC